MINAVFFIGSLQTGGAEAKLVRNFLPMLKQRDKVTPKLLLLQKKGKFLDELPPDIEKLSLNETADTNLVNIILRFRNAIKKLDADIVISCMWYPATISYMARRFGLSRFRHIVHDTVNMTEYIRDGFSTERFRKLKLHLIWKAYRNADAIVVISNGVKSDFVTNYKVPKEKIQVIYNPLNKMRISELAAEDTAVKNESPLIVSVGRLVYQKGFDILLRAFRRVRNSIPSKLLIIGDGEKRRELIQLTKSLDLQNEVTFLEFQHNPFKYMKIATVFCLASRYEGFGNVILEAMTLGIPVVATDCPSGPAEILDNGKYGILVQPNDHDSLAEALLRVLTDTQLRDELSRLSIERSQFFDFDTAIKQWWVV